MSYNMCYVKSYNIYRYVMLYDVCCVMLCNMCHVMLYNMCHDMLFNMCHVKLYNTCHVVIQCVFLCYITRVM